MGTATIIRSAFSNTIESYLILTVCSLVLAASCDGSDFLDVRIIPALQATFVLGRVCFIIGYLTKPYYRIPFFTMTFLTPLFTAAYVAFKNLGVFEMCGFTIPFTVLLFLVLA